MALDASKVRVGITGAVYNAPAGTTLPTTAVATLDANFKDSGYISDDGITESYDEDQTQIKAWQNGATVRTLTTSSEVTWAFTIIETKKTSLELFHKNSTVVSDGGTGFKLDVKTPGSDRRRFVIDVVDGSDIIRIVIPDGEVTERGEVTYANEEAIGYPVTITGYPDSSNVVATKYSNAAAWNVA